MSGHHGAFKTSFNTSVDANGFLKSASPVVRLFKDHIELNSDAEKQPIEFKKVDVGDYLLKGSLGFAQEGWYIEVPKDANGNTIVAVVYDTLENGDLSIKTYKRKFDFELAAVVADWKYQQIFLKVVGLTFACMKNLSQSLKFFKLKHLLIFSLLTYLRQLPA